MSTINARQPVLIRVLITALLLLAVAACTTPAPSPSPERGEYTTDENRIQRAREALRQAQSADSPKREQLYIEAATLFSEAKRFQDAEDALREVAGDELDIPLLADYSLTHARVALADDRYFEARDHLTNQRLMDNQERMSSDQQRRWHHLRGDLFSLLGEELTAVREYVQLTDMLDDNERIASVHNGIWQALGQIPEGALQDALEKTDEEANEETNEAVVRGWLELALVSRQSHGDIGLQVGRIEDWRDNNSSHPAARIPPASLEQAARARDQLPARLALLLPRSGEFAPAADTIRDGFLASYYKLLADSGEPPEVRMYDTTEGDITATYSRAVSDGAELVVGPLRREQLQPLISLPTLPVPVLGLNTLEGEENPHPNLYQFGLSIADEARQVADRAWIEGHRAALVIHPRTGWGATAREAFEDEWQDRDGTLVAVPPFEDYRYDFAELLRPALLLDQSEDRAQRLERLLGKDLAFTPRRRQDLDMIFLVAYPKHGRQIKPALDYLYAGDLPVYSTSHIYAGTVNPTQDRDLNGIRFTAMPWSIPALAEHSIQPGESLVPAFRNLFALGVDAYQLHQWLPLMRALEETRLHGHTGSLSMGPSNRILRVQPWAVFRSGRPVPAPQLTVDPP